jgi:hypothetical protein
MGVRHWDHDDRRGGMPGCRDHLPTRKPNPTQTGQAEGQKRKQKQKRETLKPLGKMELMPSTVHGKAALRRPLYPH